MTHTTSQRPAVVPSLRPACGRLRRWAALGSFVGLLGTLTAGAASSSISTAEGIASAPGCDPDVALHPLDFGWDAWGNLWIAEWDPRARTCRVLRAFDRAQDFYYQMPQIFLADLPWVSALLPWRDGVLLIAAPDLLYAADQDDDGHADTVRRLGVGFSEGDPANRAHSLSWALDGWIHAANGLGTVRIQRFESTAGAAAPGLPEPVDLSRDDFRFRPQDLQLEPLIGLSAAGRAYDDFGRTFVRQRDVTVGGVPLGGSALPGGGRQALPDPMIPLVYSRELPDLPTTAPGPPAQQPTESVLLPAGGIEIYRDARLGPESRGSVITWEPAMGVVWQLQLTAASPWHQARLLSARPVLWSASDPGFTPVRARTGPDGALWVADSRLRSPERGSRHTGSLWRIAAEDARLGPKRRPALLTAHELAGSLRYLTNGPQQDLASAELERQGVPEATAARLRLTALHGATPAPGRVRAMHLFARDAAASDTSVSPEPWGAFLLDPDPQIRVHALRCIRNPLACPPTLLPAVTRAADEPDPEVRLELALTLSAWPSVEAVPSLAALLMRDVGNPWIHAALLGTPTPHPLPLTRELLRQTWSDLPKASLLLNGLIDCALERNQGEDAAALAQVIADAKSAPDRALPIIAASHLLDRLANRAPASRTPLESALRDLEAMLEEAGSLARDATTPLTSRSAAVALLGWQPARLHEDLVLLGSLVTGSSGSLRAAALQALLRSADPGAAQALLQLWPRLRPSERPPALTRFLNRPAWTPLLLHAIRTGVAAATELTPSNREQLLLSADSDLRRQAAEAIASRLPPAREEPLGRLAPALRLPGNASRGREIFASLCTSCHALAGEGRAVGPDLATIGQRTAEELLVAIVDPNRAVEPRFLAWELETLDDRVLSGVLHSESADGLVLMQSGGNQESVRYEDLASARVSNYSLMPEGLEQGLEPQAVADLLAYLLRRNPPPSP